MSPDAEFQLRRILFAFLSIFSSIYGITIGLLFYDWRVDKFWFYVTIVPPTAAIFIQNAWALYKVTRPQNDYLHSLWWKKPAPRKRNVISFLVFFGYLHVHHDMREKRHEYGALLVELTAIHTCLHWLPALLFQIYILLSVGFCHPMQLLYVVLLCFAVVIFVGLVIRRYTQYGSIRILFWALLKLISDILPGAVLSMLNRTIAEEEPKKNNSQRTQEKLQDEVYKTWVFLWILPLAIQTIFYIKAKDMHWPKKAGKEGEQRRSMRLGSVVIVVWSVVMWLLQSGMMALLVYMTIAFRDKDPKPTGNQTDHITWREDILSDHNNCTKLRKYLEAPKPNYMGSPIIRKHCEGFHGLWIELNLMDFRVGVGPFVFAGVMIFMSLVVSEFFLTALLKILFKGEDAFLKSRPTSGTKFDASTYQSKADISHPDSEIYIDVANDRQLNKCPSRVDFSYGSVAFKKGELVNIVEHAGDMWKISVDGHETKVHRGVFQEVPDFELDNCQALYDYDPDFDSEDAGSGDDLQIEYDDEVLIYLKPKGKEWWFGQVANKTGWVPSNYLERMYV